MHERSRSELVALASTPMGGAPERDGVSAATANMQSRWSDSLLHRDRLDG